MERAVRQDMSEEQSTGKNGAGKNASASPQQAEPAPTRTENSVERSLEEFIARANSTFVEMDGWGLEEERAAEERRLAAQKAAAEQALKAEAARAEAAHSQLQRVEQELARTRAELTRSRTESASSTLITTMPFAAPPRRTPWGAITFALVAGAGVTVGIIHFGRRARSA